MVQNSHSQKKSGGGGGGGLCVLSGGGGEEEGYGGVVAMRSRPTTNTQQQQQPPVVVVVRKKKEGVINELLDAFSDNKWLLNNNNPFFHHHQQQQQQQLLPPTNPFQDFIKCREIGEFLSGALAGAMTKAVLAPLETIRTRMVVGVGSRSIPGSFIEVVEKQGWQGLWAGNAINMLRIIPTQAIELGTFECVKRSMTTAQEKWITEQPSVQIGHVNLKFSLSWLSPIAVAGAAAGFVSTLVCHPLEVLKDRLTVSPEAYPSLAIAVSKIYKDSGVGGFYSGIFPTVIGMLPYSTCYYFMYETMKNSYCVSKKKKALNRGEMLLLGALSGFTASTISFPLEVARKRLMVGALKGKCPPNMVAALAEVLRDEGLLGLYRGWGASCLKVMPSSGITWMFYEAWKDILLAERRHL